MLVLPQAARFCLVSVWFVALFAALSSLLVASPAPITALDLLAAVLFAALLDGADLLTLRVESGRSASLSLAPLIASLSVLAWPLPLLVVLLGTYSAALAHPAPWWRTLFTVALRAIVVATLALVAWLTQSPLGLPFTTLPGLLSLVLLGVLGYSLEQGLETLLDWCCEQAPPMLADGLRLAVLAFRAPWGDQSHVPRWYLVAAVPLGGLLALLWTVSSWALLLGIAPALVARYALRTQIELRQRSQAFERLASRADQQAHRLAGLQSLATTLIATRDLQALPHTLCDRLAALLGAPGAWVVLIDDNGIKPGETMYVVARTGAEEQPDGDDPAVAPEPLPAMVAQSYTSVLARQRVVLFTDQHVQALTPLNSAVLWQALIVIPLLIEQPDKQATPMGAICLAFERVRGLSEDEQRILSAFGRQAALAVDNAQLFRRLRESQAELIESSKLAAVGTFAAGIAHEFNNLLAGMTGYAQLGLSSDDLEEKNESLKVVVDACQRGKSVTGSLLTFARRQQPHRELADIGDAIAGTLTLMEIELRKFNVTIERRIEPVPYTVCDVGQIAQVFLNLLTNARDAMRPDGGNLTVEMFARDGNITLSVQDTGCGIPDAIRDKIFEPFVTTKGALGSSQTPGTGLGLSVSYGIVQAHSGSIEIASAPGRGTRVSVRLPIANASDLPAEQPTSSDPLPTLRLLLVDDDERVRWSFQRLLEQSGHHVTAAGDGTTALEMYRERPFDLVLSDIAMPGMDGLTLAREIIASDPDATVLLCTGHALDAQLDQARSAGVAAVLNKPFDMAEFHAAVAQAWRSTNAAA